MYAGQVVETGTADDIFYRSAHPYTLGLKQAMPGHGEGEREKLLPIDGSPPDLFSPPVGCGYFDRCPNAMNRCRALNPALWTVEGTHQSRCWLHHEKAPAAPGLHRGLRMKEEALHGSA
jgi:oligopeptide/dipeptide ABC transporter ATP-binding protein